MTLIITNIIFILVLNICYQKITTKYNYDPAKDVAIGIHTGDAKLATVSLIKVLIITLLLAALLKYSLLAVLEFAIAALLFFGVS